MLSLFKKRKKHKAKEHDPTRYASVKRMAAWFLGRQRHCADMMQRKSERLSPTGKLVLLSLFCLSASSMSIYLVATSLSRKTNKVISVPAIKTPAYTARTGDENTRSPVLISRQEFLRIERFRRYMDSLSRNVSGRLVYDSIVKRRPGLMDSLALIEHMYQSQTKSYNYGTKNTND